MSAATTALLERARCQLFPSQDQTTPTAFDALLTKLIEETCDRAELERGIPFLLATRTELIEADDTDCLYLTHGPLVSVTKVELVVFSENATTGDREETATEIKNAFWIEGGTADSGHVGRGHLDRIAGCWTPGCYYRVEYEAGFAALPRAVENAIVNEVMAEFVSRDNKGVSQIKLDDFEIRYSTPERRVASFRSALSAYRVTG